MSTHAYAVASSNIMLPMLRPVSAQVHLPSWGSASAQLYQERHMAPNLSGFSSVKLSMPHAYASHQTVSVIWL